MLLLLDPHVRVFHRLGDRFFSRTLVRSWEDLDRLTPDAECCVLVVERADLARSCARLRWYRRRHPLQPVVLVTEASAWAPRPIRGAEVVPLNGVEHALASAVRRAVLLPRPAGSAAAAGDKRGARVDRSPRPVA